MLLLVCLRISLRRTALSGNTETARRSSTDPRKHSQLWTPAKAEQRRSEYNAMPAAWRGWGAAPPKGRIRGTDSAVPPKMIKMPGPTYWTWPSGVNVCADSTHKRLLPS